MASLLLCLTFCAACAPDHPDSHTETTYRKPSGDRPSVLLITLDTTRPDHLEPYGAEDAATPALETLAEHGIVFEHAMATAPVTAPAHASLLTGLYTPHHGLRNNLTHHLADGVPTLAEQLAADGYRTAAFVSAIVLDRRYGLERGFELYDDDVSPSGASRPTRMVTERRADVTADRALAWLDTIDPATRFFLWVHFYDPHLPYDPPSPWAERFESRPYDGEIAFMDAEIGRLLSHPRVAGDQVVVVAVGDHGEGLGEHDEDDHGLLVYDSTIHVPWIMRLPGGPTGLRVTDPVSQVDLVPTIADLVSLDVTTAFGKLDGRSVLPLLGSHDRTPDRLLFAESVVAFYSYGWSPLRTVRRGSLKLIDAPVVELYDLERDPGESHNVARERVAEVRSLSNELDAWESDAEGPDSTIGVDSETAEQLRALGYLAGDTGRPKEEARGNPVELMAVHHQLQTVGELLASGRTDEAVARAHEALAVDPDNLAALRDLSRGLVQLGRLDDAAATATHASAIAPWSVQALMVEADVEHRRGHSVRALELIDRALDLDDRLLEARLDRARYLAAVSRRDEAVSELKPLAAEYPDNNWVALRYAELVDLEDGDYTSAERRLREVVTRNPLITEAWLLLGTVAKRAGHDAEAIAVYREAIAHNAANPDLLARLALLLAERGDPDAENAVLEAIRASPAPRADLALALGDLLAADGRSLEARRYFDLAASAPAFSDGTRNAKAMAMMRLGRTSEAEALWTTLVGDRPGYAKAWQNLSSLAIQRRDWRAVERFARNAVELDPTSAPSWNNLAIGLEELGRLGDAEAAYRHALEIDDDWRAAFNLGILLRKNERYTEAAAVQERVLAREPEHAGAHFELGMLYAGPLADVARAKVHLRAAIAADPDGPRARQARAVLEQISR